MNKIRICVFCNLIGTNLMVYGLVICAIFTTKLMPLTHEEIWQRYPKQMLTLTSVSLLGVLSWAISNLVLFAHSFKSEDTPKKL